MIPDAARAGAGIAGIGGLIEDAGRRERWIGFVRRLHGLASPGGPLDGYVFHGTERARGARIRHEGVLTTAAVVNGRGRRRRVWRRTRGTHWGTPMIASFYAEDLIESLEEQILFSIVAANLDDLERRGDLRPDGQSLDCPVVTRLGIDDGPMLDAAHAAWNASPMEWIDSMAFTGSLVCLAPIPAGMVEVLDDEIDLDAWIAEGIRPSMRRRRAATADRAATNDDSCPHDPPERDAGAAKSRTLNDNQYEDRGMTVRETRAEASAR